MATSAILPETGSAEALTVFADYRAYPKNWEGEAGDPQGIMIDILAEVTKRTGIEFTVKMMPWNRAFEKSKHGEGAIVGLSKTTERLKTWDYSRPMYYDELVLVAWRQRLFDYSGLISLAGKDIGVKLGASYGDDFEAAVQSQLFRVVPTHDRVGQLRMLARGRLDAVLVSPGAFALEPLFKADPILETNRAGFVVLSPAVKQDPNYLGIPKSMKKSHLLDPINQALLEIKEDGTHDEIVLMNTRKATDHIWQGH